MSTSHGAVVATTATARAQVGPLRALPGRSRTLPFIGAALAGLASVALTPPQRPEWTLAAFAMAGTITIASLAIPWRRISPAWQLAPALASLAVIAALRHGAGGAESGYGPLAMIPVLWLAMYGTRMELTVVLIGSVLLFAVPTVALGAPDYPPGEWRRSVLFVGTAAMVGYVVQTILGELRAREATLTALGAELSRSNRELQEFASVAAHDLQEPLRKIQAFGDRLEMQAGEGLAAPARDSLGRMRAAAARMQALIADLLMYSRVATHHEPPRAVDLNTVAAAVVEDLEARIVETGGAVNVGILPTIEADPRQMQQLLQNLIGNALKLHRPNAGSSVGISAVDADPREVVLEVADDGIGFDDAYAERIFAPFQRLHGRSEFEGTGMGLAICRRIVERHGGTITVQSETGSGTAFTIRLPRRQSESRP